MNIQALIQQRPLYFDGAMGTMLQSAGLEPGALPEEMNITHPQALIDIHRAYTEAGADIATANTFQANELKLARSRYSPEELIAAAVRNARAGGARYVALDMGPLGQLMEPMGTVSFERAYEIYRRQVAAGAKAGADLIVIETLSDLYEARAAILAAKENSGLPVLCSLSFQQDSRTFVGCDPLSAAVTLSALGVDALGVNCSLGPVELLPVVEVLLRHSRVPVLVQANAGLPAIVNGETVYNITPQEYARAVAAMVEQGVRIVGGCCGTSPAFISALRAATAHIPVRDIPRERVTAACSGSRTVVFNGRVSVIGERINPTGKKRLKVAIREDRMDYLLGEAIDQVNAGSDLLDVNVGLPEIDEPAMLAKAVRAIQGVVNTPLQIDSADPAAIEAAVRVYNGKPLINSVNGKAESMAAVLPVAKKYGALVLGLTLDESGIPATAEGRLAVARKIVDEAGRHGIPREDVLIDCLVLTASAQQEQVSETLRAIRLVKAELGVHTVLGVSNVSFGLPARQLLNASFLAAAFGAGLDAPILNPLSGRYREVVDCFRVLNNEDKKAARFISRYAGEVPAAPAPAAIERDLMQIIMEGRREEAAPKVNELLGELQPLDIVNRYFVPALDAVGADFEAGKLFLPQLMQAADTVKNGFEVIRARMAETGEKREPRGRILMATVQGDIHDIGKNIVRMILENYGYDVLDLGKDVPIAKVVDTIRGEGIRLAGLSALMTTTVASMKETITAVRAVGLDCVFFVGGAVLSPKYADYVGAEYYARDAMDSVAIANRFFGHK